MTKTAKLHDQNRELNHKQRKLKKGLYKQFTAQLKAILRKKLNHITPSIVKLGVVIQPSYSPIRHKPDLDYVLALHNTNLPRYNWPEDYLDLDTPDPSKNFFNFLSIPPFESPNPRETWLEELAPLYNSDPKPHSTTDQVYSTEGINQFIIHEELQKTPTHQQFLNQLAHLRTRLILSKLEVEHALAESQELLAYASVRELELENFTTYRNCVNYLVNIMPVIQNYYLDFFINSSLYLYYQPATLTNLIELLHKYLPSDTFYKLLDNSYTNSAYLSEAALIELSALFKDFAQLLIELILMQPVLVNEVNSPSQPDLKAKRARPEILHSHN